MHRRVLVSPRMTSLHGRCGPGSGRKSRSVEPFSHTHNGRSDGREGCILSSTCRSPTGLKQLKPITCWEKMTLGWDSQQYNYIPVWPAKNASLSSVMQHPTFAFCDDFPAQYSIAPSTTHSGHLFFLGGRVGVPHEMPAFYK